MFQVFEGAVVADLCDQVAAYCETSPRSTAAAMRALSRQIRAGLPDVPAAKAALLAELAK